MRKRGDYAALALLFGIVWGHAGHWLITPHADASGTRVALVWTQLVLGLAAFAWALLQERRVAAADKSGRTPNS